MIQDSFIVSNVVFDYPAAAQVFQAYKVDFCCHGNLSISDAAQKGNIDVSALMADLNQIIDDAKSRAKSTDNKRDMPTGELVDYIVEKHHNYIRQAVPFLVPLAEKVARVHGPHNPKLVTLSETFSKVADMLMVHIGDEERSLFPAMKAYKGEADQAFTEEIENMVNEHLEVAKLLEDVRAAADDFMVPEWGCTSYRTLFDQLEAFEADLFTHVHLENNGLRPRFL